MLTPKKLLVFRIKAEMKVLRIHKIREQAALKEKEKANG